MRRARSEATCTLLVMLTAAGTAAIAQVADAPVVLHAARLLEVGSGRIVAPAEVLVGG